jgi:hypothetical protein
MAPNLRRGRRRFVRPERIVDGALLKVGPVVRMRSMKRGKMRRDCTQARERCDVRSASQIQWLGRSVLNSTASSRRGLWQDSGQMIDQDSRP